jgi:hypothetical protein
MPREKRQRVYSCPSCGLTRTRPVAKAAFDAAYYKRRWIEAVKGLETLRQALADFIRITEMERENWDHKDHVRLAEIRELAALPPQTFDWLMKTAEEESASRDR